MTSTPNILKCLSYSSFYRGGLVDKDSQYKFLYKTLFDYWKKKNRITSTASLSVNILNLISLEDRKEETEMPNDTKNVSDFKHRNFNIFWLELEISWMQPLWQNIHVLFNTQKFRFFSGRHLVYGQVTVVNFFKLSIFVVVVLISKD